MHHWCSRCAPVGVGQEGDGVSVLRRLGDVRGLDEKRFVFDAMISGWSDQQAGRGLAQRTVLGPGADHPAFRRLHRPVEWSPGDLEGYTTQAKGNSARPNNAVPRYSENCSADATTRRGSVTIPMSPPPYASEQKRDEFSTETT